MFQRETYLDALTFAARAHGDQKTPTALPYVVHLTSVAVELIAAFREEPGHDEDLAITCALLHDVLEDTPTPREAVETTFGPRVAAGVAALTKNETLPKEQRMSDSLERILQEPREIAMVKLADRITNLAPPPPHWSNDKIRAYRAEAEHILTTLGHASEALKRRFEQRLAAYPSR